MHAAPRHCIPSLKSLPRDGKVWELRLSRGSPSGVWLKLRKPLVYPSRNMFLRWAYPFSQHYDHFWSHLDVLVVFSPLKTVFQPTCTPLVCVDVFFAATNALYYVDTPRSHSLWKQIKILPLAAFCYFRSLSKRIHAGSAEGWSNFCF